MPRPLHEGGFSLPIVLMLVGALAGASVLLTAAARGNMRGTAADVAIVQAEAWADAGIALGMIGIEKVRTLPASARSASGQPPRLRCRLGDGIALLDVSVQDEGGKIDLNYADAALLTAFFVGLGVERPKAQALAGAIIDFRDTDEETSPDGAERPAYEAAGLPYGPRNEPFRDIVEVRAVLGMTADIADRIAPFVTVHSGRDGVDPAVADQRLIATLARGDAVIGFNASADQPTSAQAPKETSLPARFAQPSQRRYYAITADAASSAARFTRTAIVDIGTLPWALAVRNPRQGAPYRFWAWRRDPAQPTNDRPVDANVPPC